MSPEPADVPPELEAEREVDLGRAWSAILHRWWLVVLAVVLGVVVGYLVSLGSGNVYQAKSTVYLGQPLSASGSAQVQSYQTNPSTVNQIARSPALVEQVAAQVGLEPGKLRAGISTKTVAGATARTGQTPLVEVIVRGPFRKKGADAANLIAEEIVDEVSTLANAKIATLLDEQRNLEQGLAEIEKGLDQLTAAQSSGALSDTDRLVLVNQIVQLQRDRTQWSSDLTQARQNLNIATEVERGKVITEAVSSKVAARSKRGGMVVGGVVGLVGGLVLALGWPHVAGRIRRPKR